MLPGRKGKRKSMLEIHSLNKSFGKHVILKDVNLSFPEGTVVGLFGPSGCGKSTFLNIVSLLLKRDSGSLKLNGKEYSGFRKKKEIEDFRISHFAYVFPEANLLSALDVEENILFPLQLQNVEVDHEKLNRLVDALELRPVYEADVDSLSSGEKQRVALLRALLLPRDVLIADEPTSHLDPEMSEKVIALLKEEAKATKKIILCSCHDAKLFDSFDVGYRMENEGFTLYEKQ